MTHSSSMSVTGNAADVLSDRFRLFDWLMAEQHRFALGRSLLKLFKAIKMGPHCADDAAVQRKIERVDADPARQHRKTMLASLKAARINSNSGS